MHQCTKELHQMATYTKRGDAWRAQVRVKGRASISRTFDTRAEAKAWAEELEDNVKRGHKPGRHTFSDAVERFRDDVSVTRKGERWETTRLNKFLRDHTELMATRLTELRTEQFTEWKNDRLKEVSPGSVLRELNLMRSVIEHARLELHWISTNPIADVKKPPAPRPRKRRVSDDEKRRMPIALGWEGGEATLVTQRVAVAFLFAIETGMRSGEITALRWKEVHARHVHVPESKNGDARDVPLSKYAQELLTYLPRDADRVFNVSDASRDALFREARDRCGFTGLKFHDTRHEALTLLARKLDVLDLARMVGQRDLRSLMIYYNPTADELADRLG